MLNKILFFLIILVVVVPANEPVKLPRLTGEIRLDGVIDEPAWQAIDPLPLVKYQPDYRGEITEPTEIRVAYDNNYIYMAGHLYTRNKSDIRGNSLYRDRWSGDDTFAIVLDTFNDNENALWFFTNPLGTRYDFAVLNDAVGGREASTNVDWNTHWETATTVTDSGWFAEIRIPFTSLRFQDNDGTVVMGMTVYRYMAVTNGRYIYPDIPPTWDRGSNKPSVAQDVILEGVYSKKPLYFTPYLLAGNNQIAQLNAANDDYSLKDDGSAEIGFDAKYNLTNNLTLDVTVNTDFAQVEADDRQVNLTRFALFFPEKRQFFQERSGIFEFRLGGDSRLFHSRTIGLNQGSPIRIWGGARLVGRVGKWDIGLLNMQTDNSSALPAENFGVLRLRRNVFNSTSDIGAMLTSRLGDDGNYNLAYGLDASLKIVGDDYLIFKAAQSADRAIIKPGKFDPLQASRFLLAVERQRQQGFVHKTAVSWSGTDFRPGIGFDIRRDFWYGQSELSYQWFTGKHPWLRKFAVGERSEGYLRNSDDELESGLINPYISIEMNNGAMIEIGGRQFRENVGSQFDLSDAVSVKPGSYDFIDIISSGRAPDGWRIRPEWTLGSGSFYDGNKHTASLSVTWNVSRYFEINPFYEINAIDFERRSQSDLLHLGRLRLRTAFSNRAFLNTFVQYSSVARQIGLNIRARYNFAEGSDFWLVYNEGLNTDRDRAGLVGNVPLPRTDNRSIIAKYTYTVIR